MVDRIPRPFILGDTCDYVVVCECCVQPLEPETVYVSISRDGIEGPAWCIPCIETVLAHAKECADVG